MTPSKCVLTAIGLPVQAVLVSARACVRVVGEAHSALAETAAVNTQARLLMDRAALVLDELEAALAAQANPHADTATPENAGAPPRRRL